MKRGIILDRDGTLIDFCRDVDLGVVTPAFHPDHVRLLPGTIDGLRRLQAAGYLLAIATNQPGAAKGEISREAIERTNERLQALLDEHGIRIANFQACLHHPEGGPGGEPTLIQRCKCRKPAPGMLNTIIGQLKLTVEASWMVGDTAADLGAAHAAGLRCALLSQQDRCELCRFRGVPIPFTASAELCAPALDQVAEAILKLDQR